MYFERISEWRATNYGTVSTESQIRSAGGGGGGAVAIWLNVGTFGVRFLIYYFLRD